MNPLEILDMLSRIGVLGVLAILIFLILSGRLVTKGHMDEIRGELHAVLARIEAAVNAIRDRRR
jgi:hypothetical protein